MPATYLEHQQHSLRTKDPTMSGKLWPHNCLTIGYLRKPNTVTQKDKLYNETHGAQYDRDAWNRELNRVASENTGKLYNHDYREMLGDRKQVWCPENGYYYDPVRMPELGCNPGFIYPPKLAQAMKQFERKRNPITSETDMVSTDKLEIVSKSLRKTNAESEDISGLEPLLTVSSEGEYSKEVVSSSGSKRKGKRHGLKGITSHGQNMVKAGAYLLQAEYTKNRLSFWTGTIPTCSERLTKWISANWGKFLKALGEALGRELEKYGLPKSYVMVTEIQEKRYWKHGCLLPHFHCLFVGKHKKNYKGANKKGVVGSGWCLSTKDLDALFQRILFNIINKGEEAVRNVEEFQTLDFRASCNIERVKKDATAYLGKYMSKGGPTLQNIIENESGEWVEKENENGEVQQVYQPYEESVKDENLESIPRKWWKIEYGLTKFINSRIIKLRSSVCEWIMEARNELLEEGKILWYKLIDVEVVDVRVSVGVGKLREETNKMTVGMKAYTSESFAEELLRSIPMKARYNKYST